MRMMISQKDKHAYVINNIILSIFIILLFQVKSNTANHPPQFLIDGQTEIVINLREGPDTPVGSLIYRLRGFDADGDVLTFGIRDQPGSSILTIENYGINEANLYLNKELDREIKDEYMMVLTLTDGHLGDGNFITQSLLLLVDDVNDNDPIFKPYSSTISVKEDSKPGVLTTVEATDIDEGPYGQVVYSLQELDAESNLFSITTVNGQGVLRLVGALDYERTSLHQLKILATDRANDEKRRTGTAAILIKVEDVEDQLPEFVSVVPIARISEDAPIGTSVLQVRAIDGDRGVNNPIVYGIVNKPSDLFGIERNTGLVYTSKKLDRESIDNGAYIIKISAEERSKVTSIRQLVYTEVTIIITDVNDETPSFRSARYTGEIQENAQTNTPVSFMGLSIPVVYDYDQGNNGTFWLFVEGDDGMFDVTPHKGINEASFLIRAKNTSKLDYEQTKVINFTLTAKEMMSSEGKYNTVPVTVYIRDVNDNFPEFSKPIYEITVPENSVGGTRIARLEATDRDSGILGTEGIRYSALRGSVADVLDLDAVTGIISIKSPKAVFDRELVSRHYLTVEARDDLGRGNRNTAQLVVNIGDVNDNPPTFLVDKYEIRLEENKMDFDSVVKIEAHDADLNGTINSEIRFSILESEWSNNFTIDPVKGIMKPATPIDFERLSVRGIHSRTNVRPVKLMVKARDLGTPSLASSIPVIIHVEDTNDHTPYFEKEFYDASIPEDLPAGSSVLDVKAMDDDGSSPNNLIVYRIQSGAYDKFIVDANTGIIRVANGASLDPDGANSKTLLYSLTVVALDGGIGEHQRSSSTLVNITIQDVNNKSPVFVNLNATYVKENTPVGRKICDIKAIDADEKPILRYMIDNENSEARDEDGTIVKQTEYDYINAFQLNPMDGSLVIQKIIDRESVESIRLALKVEDLAATNNRQISTGFLPIIIEDENDNNPVFRKTYYRKAITENSQTGLTILNVIADDEDKNRTIRYSLQGSLGKSTDLIKLDADTGEIVVAGKIDHEQISWLNITVGATDSGYPPRTSYVDVFLQIVDENDNNPYFVEDTVTNFSVSENVPIGTQVGRVLAKDADTGDFGKITYLMDRISSQGKFNIDGETGVITINDQLDRELVDSYVLVVEAWDNYQYGYATGESRNAFKQITVTVTDVNDNAPVFEHLPKGCVSITEFHEIGDVITLLKAVDADDPSTVNGKLDFLIEDGNELELFGIAAVDMWSARLITLQSLKTLYGNYSLLIRVQDKAFNAMSSLTTLDICVTDFNDNAPRFISPPHNITIRIPENATIGSTVITVEAVDDDKGPNADVHYVLKQDLTGDWKSFEIDEHKGVITLEKSLDRKKQKIYQLRVEAFDLGIPTPLSSDLDLTIYVRNINDHQPQFLVDEFTISFTEGQKPGIEHWQILDTVDRDRDELDQFEETASPVCYYIISGNDAGYFTLEPLSHKITVAKELDREEIATHVLILKASDDCLNTPTSNGNMTFDPHDDSTIQLVIRVNDINDNAPVFIKKVFTGGVTTDADFGMEFMQIQATDADEGMNAELRYHIITEPHTSASEGLENIQPSPFIMDQKTGSIYLNFDPQRGMKGYFSFYVVVNDTGGLEDTARVLIYLLREDQRVRFVLRQNPPQLRKKLDIFKEILGNVTGAIVNVDECKIHENQDGRVDKTRSDLYLHFVNPIDNTVMEVPHVLRMIDENVESLDSLFKEFNVLDTEAVDAEPLLRTSLAPVDNIIWMYLVGTTIFLILLLIVVTGLCFSQRARYQRQLKAATVGTFAGSTESDFTRTTGVTGRVPNTNIHSVEGSNPMWMQAYENEWYKPDDSLSEASERDSLDDNDISSPSNNSESSHTPCIPNRCDESPRQNGVATFIGENTNNNKQRCQNIYITNHKANKNNINNSNNNNNNNNINNINNNCHKNNNSNNSSPVKKLETTEL